MKRILIVAAVLLLAVGAVAGARWWSSRSESRDLLTVSGTVEATESRLSFQSPGRIVEIAPREGDRVTPGAVLARLDTSEANARRTQAVARIEGARALLQELVTGSRDEEIAQAAANVEAARERSADVHRDVDRNRRLHAGGAIALEVLQKSEAAAAIADAQMKQALDQQRLVQTGPRRERIDMQRAQLRDAEAALAGVDAFLANTVIAAPVAGIVTVRHHEPNETIAPGQPVLTMIDPTDRWVRVYIPENRLGSVRLGAPATIRSDTFGRKYSGRISFIASEAEFTPKNVQTTEERVRLVYAVKVRIGGDPAMELKPGMPVDVEIPLQ
ncbi:MAG TPA: HlyD family efflux transporter periplasmic adaptor subunit [Thermoanaerobaculia bacterium]|nr:HlyD family efflux transporter periplasmic adaptor subunit [Thermoanaerobaculia bacterium]